MADGMTHFKILVLFSLSSLALAAADVRCMKCDHVNDPAECDTIGICGHGEICFTREFVDHHDKHAYHLGCESSPICALYKNAEQIFVGRRDVLQDLEDPQQCFDCCSGNECNGKLCTQSGRPAVTSSPTMTPGVATKATDTTTLPPASTTVPNGVFNHGCKQGFIWFSLSNHCYLLDQRNMNWDDARAECQKLGADLISVNNEEEDKFIVNQLHDINPPDTVRGMWLGGTFDDSQDKFKWVDGSDVTFQRYKTGSPRNQAAYRLLIINPAVHGEFVGWPWSSDIGSIYKRGHICEMPALSN